VSTPTAEPATPAPAAPAHGRADAPAPTGVLRVTAIIATVGVVAALLGLLLMLRPVTTPTQDCGTSIGFLLDGRVNEFVDEQDPPEGVTAAEAKANNADPCRDRVAERAKPAGILIAGGVLVALVATLVEVGDRGLAWRRRRRARSAAPSESSASSEDAASQVAAPASDPAPAPGTGADAPAVAQD
jgi:hypothetical protein